MVPQDVNYRNALLCSRFIDFHREWEQCRVKLDVIRSRIMCGRVMLFVKTCLIPLHESCTRIITSRWLHSFTWVWHWTFTHLTFTKHKQSGMKRAELILGRRGQPAYVNSYFLLTARLLWHLIGRSVKTWGHVSHFVTLTLRRLMSYIYGAPILDVSRSHTTTQHSR